MLPNFSKFFEEVMYNRLIEFAETNEIFYLHQFGFRQKSLDITRATPFAYSQDRSSPKILLMNWLFEKWIR